MKIKICADSTCDLSPELVEKYGIGIIPLYIVKDGVSYADTLEICPEDLYEHARNGGKPCTTAAVPVSDYIDFFTEQKKTCDEIVHFHISGEMSSCYQNAVLAAGEVGGVYPVDSRNLSTGIGLLVLAAAEMAAGGDMSAAQIQAKMDEMKSKLDVSFVVDTLDYLRRGGRCSAVAAFGANILSLKPCIEVKDGRMGVGKKYRGNLMKCVLEYVRGRLEGADNVDTRRIFITESGNYTEEQIRLVRQEILKYQPFEEILHTRAGCTVSNHCGPGTLGILYFRK